MSKILKFLASLKLAVFVLLAFGLITAVGTFYESLYNAEYAKQVVYYSPLMMGIQILLAINLTAVMVDRWPWKTKHLPFLLAHIGILIVQLGALITYFYGVDGLMVFPLEGSNRYVQVSEKELSLYSSLDGNKFETLMSKGVDFYKTSPPLDYNKGSYSEIKVLDYYIFAEAKNKIISSANKSDGPAVRFFIEGERAKESGWLLVNKIFKESEKKMGPATVKLMLKAPKKSYKGENEILFYPYEDKLKYSLFNSQGKKEGFIKVGDVLVTGWMDLKLRLLSYKPHASKTVVFDKIDSPHALSTEAVKVKFLGKDYWLGLDQPVKVFESDRVYVLNYGKKRVDIGFNMKLKTFKVGRYQGSMQAASYESVVEADGKEHLISMNEPLKKNGLTFYQSSFQEDEMGRPTHSVLSVNKDPGRFTKYLGCLLISIGSILLFWFRRIGYKWRFLK